MNKLYQKSEIWFAVVWILIYSAGYALCESLSKSIGVTSSATFAFNLALSAALYGWIRQNKLTDKYGLCKPKAPAKALLFYVPLIIIATRNFWNGFGVNFPALDAICYVGSMLCVGLIEEVLFRGFLFKALAKDSLKSAVIISSLTFALGHLAHLFDGSGMTLADNLFQVFGAVSFGFACVAVFVRGGSLIPCILVHSAFDAFSAFSNPAGITPEARILSAAIQFVIFVPYGIYLLRGAKAAHADAPASAA